MVPNDIWLRTEWLSCRRTSVLRCVERYCAAAALKDRIDRQVVVHKERSGGSWVEIVT